MKVIVAGSRWIWDRTIVEAAIINSNYHISELVSGGNRGWDAENERQTGVDGFGEDWAKARGIPIKLFPPEWQKFGKRAGPLRNGSMARYADALILIWDGKSAGSASMLREARANGLLVFEVIVPEV